MKRMRAYLSLASVPLSTRTRLLEFLELGDDGLPFPSAADVDTAVQRRPS